MTTWNAAVREGLVGGSLASVLSTAVLAAAGRRQAGSAAAPVNAVSHWLWGDESLHEDRADLRHTLTGYLTHHLAAVFWATLYARLRGHPARTVPEALAGGLATSAAAAAFDYTLVPRRLTPGFEHRLSMAPMVATFGALAAGMALGALLLGKKYE